MTNITAQNAVVNLVTPDGTIQTSQTLSSGSNSFLDTQTLGKSGTYQLWLTPYNGISNIGSETFQIVSVPPDVYGGALTIPAPATTGPTGTVTTTNAGQHAWFTFSGTAGQRLSFNIANSSYPASSGCMLSMYDPSNNLLAEGGCQSPGTIGPVTLPTTGTYKIVIDGFGAVGSVSISIFNDADVIATMAIDGAAVTVTSAAFQDIRLNFAGVAGQKIYMFITNMTTGFSANFELLQPDGNEIVFMSIAGSFQMMDTITLQETGTYQCWVRNVGLAGGGTFQIFSQPPDVLGTIAIDGPAVTATTTSTAQDARLSFSATAGQRIVAYAATNVSPAADTLLVDPSGTVQGVIGFTQSGSGFLDTHTLGTSGTYQLWVQHSGALVGSETLQIASVPPDVTGPITIDGPAVTATTVVGQDVRLSFSATAGQRIVVYTTNVTNPSADVVLLEPDGTQINGGHPINNSPAGQSFFIDTSTLPTSGTYQLWVMHISANAGSETLQIASVPSDFTASTTIGGAAVRVPNTGNLAVGQNGKISFSMTAGQQVTINVSNPTFGTDAFSCLISVTNANGVADSSGQDHGSCGTGSAATIGPFTVSSTGTHIIVVDPQGTATGNVTISVVTP